MSSYHYCDRCGERVYAGQGCNGYTLDDKEVVVHSDINICEYRIRTNPDAPDAIEAASFPPLTLVGVREAEPRMTGALDPERGWWR